MLVLIVLLLRLLLVVSFNDISELLQLSCNVTSQEYNALYALYTSTNGDNWSKNCNENWVFPSDYNQPCNQQRPWYGIICNSLCQVTQLSLAHCNLNGKIPAELGNLTSMIYFDLGTNNLRGTIPTELGNMIEMSLFFLCNNSLTGTIPSSLGNMTKMLYFQIYNNSLTGIIPTQLGNMIRTQQFQVNDNSLTGSIPSELVQMKVLRYLYLQDNNLSGQIPTTLMNMSSLHSINLSNNQKLKGNLNDYFISSLHLRSLNFESIVLANLSLEGSLPDALFDLKNVNQIVLSSNCLTGTLPNSICFTPKLNTLILDGLHSQQSSTCKSNSKQKLYGTLPLCLFASPNLSVLHLAGNGLKGPLPSIPTTSGLQYLNLAGNRLIGMK